jgi:hypothetical protein
LPEIDARKQPTDKLRTNVPTMLAAVLGFLCVTYYSTMAFSAQDLLWFKQEFSETPVRLVIYHDGQRSELQAGQAGFAELAEAVRYCLDQGVMNPSNMGFSQGSLDDAFNLYVSLEAFFAGPVKLHAGFNTGHPTQMLFPITGRHSDLNVVLLGVGKDYWINPPSLKTTERLRVALQSLGYIR